MKLEIGIALQTMPCRQHRTSLIPHVATDRLSTILSHFQKLVPVDKTSGEFIGRLKGIVESVGDIESPIEGWETSQ